MTEATEKRIRQRRAIIAKLGRDKPATFEELKNARVKPFNGRTVTRNYSNDTDF
jgi:hypothetical protein